jgi:hypothetical protein
MLISQIVAMLIQLNYIVTAAVAYGMSTYMAWNLVPILNAARSVKLSRFLSFPNSGSLTDYMRGRGTAYLVAQSQITLQINTAASTR